MLKKLLIILVMSVSSQAIVESKIQKVMDKKVHQVLNILKDKSLTQKQKEQKSIRIMDSVFAYATMSKISLSKKLENTQ